MALGQYAQVTLATRAALTGSVNLPSVLQGLSNSDLADLGWTDPALGFNGTGFWPITTENTSAITYGMVASGTSTIAVDPINPVVVETLGAIAMTAAQLAAAQEVLVSEAATFITSSLNALAIAWGYTDITSAATYLNSAVAQFKAEATALTSWRDQVWYQAGVIQAEPVASQPTTVAALWAAILVAAPQPTRPTA